MILATAPVAAAPLAAIEATSYASSSPAPLVVWVDSTRLPEVAAFEKANPSVKLDVITYDGDPDGDGTLQSKFALYNRVGHGWPDVFYSEENTDAVSIAEPPYNDAEVLSNGLVPKSVLDQFGTGTQADCTVNGKLVCIRDANGQDVLWYNKTLMAKFGYAVPTTWAQWQKIGEKVAKQHPGYIVGVAGDTWDDEIYLQASQCPMAYLVNEYTVKIDPASPDCTRVATLLDPLIKDGSLPVTAVFNATFPKQYGAKVLMMVGPSWYGDYVFESASAIHAPAGEIAAAPPLTWSPGHAPVTGDVGGGIWFVSSHTKQPQAAAALVTWITTQFASEGQAPTYPTYIPLEAPWVAEQEKSNYFAEPLGPVFASSATEVWTGWAPTRYNSDAVWSQDVIPVITSGGTLASALPAFGTGLKDSAQVDGYTVVG
jgi:ABC-type glycerol-3-phosphate transport system substrate-binding protein